MCCCSDPIYTISDFADIANIIVAAINLLLAYYIFVYQKGKDQESKIEALKFQEQNIKLQWFKELIIHPHLIDIDNFYKNIRAIENRITSTPISEDIQDGIVNYIKHEQSILRKSFVDVLHGVNETLHDEILKNLDNLIDEITNVIFNDGLNLTHKPTFEKEIGSKITYSYNDLIKRIYNYKGV